MNMRTFLLEIFRKFGQRLLGRTLNQCLKCVLPLLYAHICKRGISRTQITPQSWYHPCVFTEKGSG